MNNMVLKMGHGIPRARRIAPMLADELEPPPEGARWHTRIVYIPAAVRQQAITELFISMVPGWVARMIERRAEARTFERLRVAVATLASDETPSAPAAPTSTSHTLLTPEQFAAAVGIGRTTIYKLIKDEGFPAPRIPHVGPRVDLEQGRAWLMAKGFKNTTNEAKARKKGGRRG